MDSEIKLRGVNIFYLGTRENGVDSFVYRTDMVVVSIPVSEPVSLEAFGLSISRMIGLKKVHFFHYYICVPILVSKCDGIYSLTAIGSLQMSSVRRYQ